MVSQVDLHIHTRCSDGFLSSLEVVERAARRGVKAISITDHDSIEAYTPELEEYIQQYRMTLVAGVEISTVNDEGYRFHILGYGIDVASHTLNDGLRRLKSSRNNYTQQATVKMRAYGWVVDAATLEKVSVVTKAHIADSVLYNIANKKLLERVFSRIPSRGEFIEAMLNQGMPCYVKRYTIQPHEAVELIHKAGGVAIFAHPVAAMYEQGLSLQNIERCILESGVDGVEALYYYYYRSGGDVEIDRIDDFIRIARRHQLYMSIGSDFHGVNKELGAFTEIGLAGKVSWRQYAQDLAPLLRRLQITSN